MQIGRPTGGFSGRLNLPQSRAWFAPDEEEDGMNAKKVFAGAIVWTIGLLVPMLYHALLMHAAVQEDGYGYSYHHMVKYFFDLPWLVWPYILAMGIVGAMLVVSGVKDQSH